MNSSALTSWLSKDRSHLRELVKQSVSSHVDELTSKASDLYGYAVCPGPGYEINAFHTAWSSESELKERLDGETFGESVEYYRFGVHEWPNWDECRHQPVTDEIQRLNEEFDSLHKRPEEFIITDEELAHLDSYRSVIVEALAELKDEGKFKTFSDSSPFLILWENDAEREFTVESVRVLSSPADYEGFRHAFIDI